MEVNQAIRTRRSIRSFIPEPISKQMLQEIVDTCRWSPSSGNTQPWEMAILGGSFMAEFKKRLFEKMATNAPSESEFPQPQVVPEINLKRRLARLADINTYLYPHGTDNVEEKKHEYFFSGARMFDAPNAIIIFADKSLLEIPWGSIDIGIITQSICLAAHSLGLATCITGRPSMWPNFMRELLGLDKSKAILLVIAIGYPVIEAKVNTIPRTRAPLEEWLSWYGF